MHCNRLRSPQTKLMLVLFVLAAVVLTGCGGPAEAPATMPSAQRPAALDERSAAPPDAPAKPTERSATVAKSRSGLPTIRYEDLPREAKKTISLIEQDGPFPFDRDGITFQNREQLLPNRPKGYYREYTVITPGSSDRGARRIVAGAEGELYYTDDHYESFKEVVQ